VKSVSIDAAPFDQYKTVAGYRTSQAQARTWKRITRITVTLPRDLTAAIAEWRMLQLGQPKLATAIVELIAAWLSATTVIHEGESDTTTQDAPTETPAETDTAT
jgi:hypothetical protein